jgi:hypothetical protein
MAYMRTNEKFNVIIKSMFLIIMDIKSQIQSINRILDVLLPKLMSAEIWVEGFKE